MDALSWRGWLLAFACLVVGVELAFRRFAPASAAYKRWTRGFEAVGSVWTALLLGVIYAVSVSPVNLGFRLIGRDLLDRSLRPEPSFWRPHQPNPLGPRRAARHQF